MGLDAEVKAFLDAASRGGGCGSAAAGRRADAGVRPWELSRRSLKPSARAKTS